ncbi:high affinity immunoglobulin gamma Fc receptor I-like [Dendropsophus ebraccatus]|uniref:high affinity immunoglobulin gamma Fc receptor I-like n=1 Tax=Dendropsophus ebraccatus TaxID=150705 RepID=UPI003831E62F
MVDRLDKDQEAQSEPDPQGVKWRCTEQDCKSQFVSEPIRVELNSLPISLRKGQGKLFKTTLVFGLLLIQEGAAIRPVVTFTPDYRKIFTSEDITMSCDVASTIGEELRYIWYKDSAPIYNGKSYTIPHAGTSHGGSYRCETSNGGRSDPVILDVSADWLILQTPLYVYEGDDITIRCHLRPVYTGGQTIFYKDNRIIRDWTENAEYHIGNVDRNTAGTYTCVKEVYYNRRYNRHEDTISISVEELFTTPTIKLSPHPVIEGGNMTLTCERSLHSHRHNTQLRVTFYREGRIVRRSGVSDIYGVYNVQLEDSGKYSCEVETTDGRVRKRSAERVIQIEELFSHPDITVTGDMYEGDPMTLTCNTALSPYIKPTEVQFAFYRDGRTVQEFSSSNKYEVQSAHLEDSGNYTCEIKTSLSTIMRRSNRVYIHIQGPSDNIGYTRQNIIRLTISGCVIIAAALLVFHHIKWVMSMEAADTSTVY